jgi:hypothetical protein
MEELCQSIVNVVIPLFTEWYAVRQLFLAARLEEKSWILPSIQRIMQRDEPMKAEEMDLLSIDALTRLVALRERLRTDVAITQSSKGTTAKNLNYRDAKSVSTETWEAIKQCVDDFTTAVENHDISKITAPHHSPPTCSPISTRTTHKILPVVTWWASAAREQLELPVVCLSARTIEFSRRIGLNILVIILDKPLLSFYVALAIYLYLAWKFWW